VVFFPPNAAAILKRRHKSSGQVFTNSRGKPWTKNTLVGWMRKLREKSGLEGTAYAYRHSYATRALEQGVGPADLAEILGTSVEVISRNYSHLDQSKKRLAEIAGKVR
jgi:integrase